MNRADVTRLILGATIEKAINDIEADPARSVRNLVELGQNFVRGRFQQYFFDLMGSVLKNRESAYYQLAEKIVSSVDRETIKTFGINIGYDGFTLGAARIRETEAQEGYNIPWTAAFRLDTVRESSAAETDSAISQFRELGVFCYILFCGPEPEEWVYELFRKYPDCAFILLMSGECVGEDTADILSKYKNLMVAISADSDSFSENAAVLRSKKLLYAVYTVYSDKTAGEILSDSWLKRAAPETGAFAFLISGPDAGESTRSDICDYVKRVRREQKYPLFLMDMASDIMYIDQVISDDACSVLFGEDGQLVAPEGRTCGEGLNLRNTAVREILRTAYPKK